MMPDRTLGPLASFADGDKYAAAGADVNAPVRMDELTYFRGRVALYAILEALGIGAGDDVIIQAYTCAAVPEAVLASGAAPIYVDIVPDGYTIDASDLERKLTPRTKAIVVQHTFGIPGASIRVEQLAHERKIHIIEDCCHSWLSEQNGRRIGSIGVASFYSFEWGKPLVAGMGGSVITANEKLRNRLARNYEAFRDPPRTRNARIELEYLAYSLVFRPRLYWIARRLRIGLNRLGVLESTYNHRYGEGSALEFRFRMASSPLRRLRRGIPNIRRIAGHSDWVANQYRNRIRTPFVSHPVLDPEARIVFGRYPLTTGFREEIMRRARYAMVESAGWYATPVHPLAPKDWRTIGYTAGSCPNAELRVRETITLPTHGRVLQKDIDRTVEFLNSLRLWKAS